MKHQSLIKLGNAALAFGLLTSTVAGTLLIATTPASAAPAPTSSAATVVWAGNHTDTTDPDFTNFENLTLTVGQTANLVNQGVTVSWTDGKPTSSNEYATNFMQIMQCWGDDPAGPTADQCMWGTPASGINGLIGSSVGGRDLQIGADPLQDPMLQGAAPDPRFLLEAPPENPNQKSYSYPFTSVDGTLSKSPNEISKVFSSNTTNEVTGARTGTNGDGAYTFEVQTGAEAPHLGCGAAVASSSTPRSCWLVVVPRGSHNLDGSAATVNASGRISGSPLSASAWKNRMVVKLDFQPTSVVCPLGNAERRIVGSEIIAEAITSWQPSLCATGSTYGYSLIGDGEARRQIVSDFDGAARLAVVSDPLDTATQGDAKSIVYAPIAQGALVVAFSIDYRLFPDAAAAAKNGQPVDDLTLNARLMAKLLTQSYRIDVPGGGGADPVIASNPVSILTDPEFLELNPSMVGFTTDVLPAGLMVALGNADANAVVWNWIRSDPFAAAFLAGEKDEWGMGMNPQYLPLSLATDTTLDSFPKADLTIAKGSVPGETGYGTLDLRPYMNDMHEGAQRTLKADGSSKTNWDPLRLPASYISTGAQLPGSRFILSITDAASAARYGLSTAKLVNAANQSVAPTDAAIAKAVAAMPASSVPGVVIADPGARVKDAYPLSLVTYAAVNVCASTKDELADYAKLITYAVGPGQVSGDSRGQLPKGYVPLSAASVTAATSAAAAISDAPAVSALCDPPATPAPTVTPTPTKTPKPTSKPTKSPTPSAVPTVPAVVIPQVTAEPTEVPVAVVTDPEESVVQTTGDQPLSGARVTMAGALGLGIPSLIAGPLLMRRGRKLARLMDLE